MPGEERQMIANQSRSWAKFKKKPVSGRALVKLPGMTKVPHLFTRLRSGFGEQGVRFRPSFHCSGLYSVRPISHALLCHHHPQYR